MNGGHEIQKPPLKCYINYSKLKIIKNKQTNKNHKRKKRKTCKDTKIAKLVLGL